MLILLTACGGGQQSTEVPESAAEQQAQSEAATAQQSRASDAAARENGDGDQESTAKEGEAIVEMVDLAFVPEAITISTGTTVTWINKDDVEHDVTSGKSVTGREARGKDKTKFPDGKFQSGLFGKGKTFSYTFTKEGEYPYYCDAHPFMTAEIIVE